MKLPLILTLTATLLFAETIPVKRLIKVIDGDTIKVEIKSNYDFLKVVNVRIKNVDTPELKKSKCVEEKRKAERARNYVESLLRRADKITLREVHGGMYFRLLADVYADEINVADRLISMGYAREYYGNKRKGWCE